MRMSDQLGEVTIVRFGSFLLLRLAVCNCSDGQQCIQCLQMAALSVEKMLGIEICLLIPGTFMFRLLNERTCSFYSELNPANHTYTKQF